MNFYEKLSLIRKLENMADFIAFETHHGRVNEEQAEQELDKCIAKFNRELLEMFINN